MNTLKQKLEEFANSELLAINSSSIESINELNQKFADLAPYFLSGGYIKVRNEYYIYPTTIEFYFHSENPKGVKDDIVYHRKDRVMNENLSLPYFPIMSLHAHSSGFDITFEKEGQYRASALIREYQIWDKNNSCWLKWGAVIHNIKGEQKKVFCFLNYDDANRIIQIKNDKTPINTQVYYLKTFLNGFVMGDNDIIWEDARTLLEAMDLTPPKPRLRVYDPKNNEQWKDARYDEPRSRLWSFSRKEPVPKPIH